MIWFTSDEHYGHDAIIGHCVRPFADVADMERRLIQIHNERVAPGDIVYHLGDFCLRSSYEALGAIVSKLHGTHVLIAGNHNRCHPIHRRGVNEERRYKSAGFAFVAAHTIIQVPGAGRVLLTHLPPSSRASTSDPFARWRPSRELVEEVGDGVHLHGHVHRSWQTRGRLINVGVDVWGFAPVSAAQIAKLAASATSIAAPSSAHRTTV